MVTVTLRIRETVGMFQMAVRTSAPSADSKATLNGRASCFPLVLG